MRELVRMTFHDVCLCVMSHRRSVECQTPIKPSHDPVYSLSSPVWADILKSISIVGFEADFLKDLKMLAGRTISSVTAPAPAPCPAPPTCKW